MSDFPMLKGILYTVLVQIITIIFCKKLFVYKKIKLLFLISGIFSHHIVGSQGDYSANSLQYYLWMVMKC